MFNSIDPFKGVKLAKCICGCKPCGIFTFGNEGKPFGVNCESCGLSSHFYPTRKEVVKAWKNIVSKKSKKKIL